MPSVVTNAESCKRYRESRKHDPVWSEKQRERTRERTREYRERARGAVAPVLSPVMVDEPVVERDPLADLADLLANGIIDREPEPDDPLARVRWKFWRDIREKEVREGVSIFQGTCPEDVERYRLRFGLDLLAVLAEC